MHITITEMWKVYGTDICSRSTFSAIFNGSYASMNSSLAQDVLAFIDGYMHPENYGF